MVLSDQLKLRSPDPLARLLGQLPLWESRLVLRPNSLGGIAVYGESDRGGYLDVGLQGRDHSLTPASAQRRTLVWILHNDVGGRGSAAIILDLAAV